MANSNTICACHGVAASGNVTAETAFGQASATTVRAFAQMPSTIGNDFLDGRELLVRAAWIATTGGVITYQPAIRFYRGDQTGLTTFTNDVAIAVPTAVSISTTTRLLMIKAWLWWDKTTARLNGHYCLQADTAFTAYATLTAGLSTNVANASSIGFFSTGIFGTTQASNTAILKYLEIDAL
tara:strand:+ start:502 stop:1047 length:546 start_codon:yes stop_codon:yes gene_type:complete